MKLTMHLVSKTPRPIIQKAKWLTNRLIRGIRLYQSNRSITAWLSLSRYLFRKAFNSGVPNLITIGVTYRCQCNCVHCSSNVPNRNSDGGLSTSQVESIIDQANNLGVVRVTFFGGEPLLRNDIAELVRYAHDRGMITRINTNGWLLNRELVCDLKAAGLTQCDVSIDDPDPDVHNRLRGLPGLFQKAVEGIKILNQYNILCQIVTYAAKRNVPAGLEKIIQLGRELGVFAVSIVFPMATGCWYDAFDQLLTEEEKIRVRQLGDSNFVHVELPTSGSRCNVLKKTSLYVSPDADITPCPFIPYGMGNIKDLELADIWHRFIANANLTQTGDCPMNDVQCREKLKSGLEAMYKIPRELSVSHPRTVVPPYRASRGHRDLNVKKRTERICI